MACTRRDHILQVLAKMKKLWQFFEALLSIRTLTLTIIFVSLPIFEKYFQQAGHTAGTLCDRIDDCKHFESLLGYVT